MKQSDWILDVPYGAVWMMTFERMMRRSDMENTIHFTLDSEYSTRVAGNSLRSLDERQKVINMYSG